MPNLTQLRLAARQIFVDTLRAVDTGAAMRDAVELNGPILKIRETTIDIRNRNVYSIAIGKAALPMAIALEETIGEALVGGVISAPVGTESKLGLRWRVYEGGHPLPNESSLLAAKATLELLDRANQERALVIFLVSGGGSAMLEWPIRDEINLDDLREANLVLTSCGASITEINAVRRTFSAVKGGRLAARAPDCEQITMIISDVPKGEERNVASGPTLTPSTDAPNVRAVIARYDLRRRLPATILRAVESEPEPLYPGSSTMREHFVLLDNDDALEAAAESARKIGFISEIAKDVSDQPIDEGCDKLLSRLEELRRKEIDKAPEPGEQRSDLICLVSGGEFACPVKGEGIGGRNLETALRLAIKSNQRPDANAASTNFVAICVGTDGLDGNSPAAGAIVDSTTIARAEAVGLDPRDFLERSDAYSFFVALGDAIATGPTGTNVRDIRILLGELQTRL